MSSPSSSVVAVMEFVGPWPAEVCAVILKVKLVASFSSRKVWLKIEGERESVPVKKVRLYPMI